MIPHWLAVLFVPQILIIATLLGGAMRWPLNREEEEPCR